jgi:hypothetical protein
MSEMNLVAILLDDVKSAHLRHKAGDTQTSRRDLVRTVFAAIDGMAWIYREFVRENIGALELIEPDEELALSEMTYSVSEAGKVIMQRKYISTASAIRLAARLINRAVPSYEPDFAGVGWACFKTATDIRNRITHPKSEIDLRIDDTDIRACLDGFYWLMELLVEGMEIGLDAVKSEAKWTRGFLDELNAGNPRAWADYLAAQARSKGST